MRRASWWWSNECPTPSRRRTAAPETGVARSMTQLPKTAEVVIVGAGIMGCSIAYHLAERGLRDIVVLERDAIGRGATADAAGGIRLQFSTETNIRLSQISLDYWEHFDERFGTGINFRQQGYLFLLTDADEVAVFQENLALQQS